MSSVDKQTTHLPYSKMLKRQTDHAPHFSKVTECFIYHQAVLTSKPLCMCEQSCHMFPYSNHYIQMRVNHRTLYIG